MGTLDFIVQNWTPRETGQVALKFGLLLLPIVIWRVSPVAKRTSERLVALLGAATAVLALVVAAIQLTSDEFTRSLNAWQDAEFAVEIAGYQFSFAAVGAWCALLRRSDMFHGVAFALLLATAIAALGNAFGFASPSRQIAQLGGWALALGVALAASTALGRIAWIRAQLAVVAIAFGWFALVHLHGWLIAGHISMGNVGPSLWHDVTLPLVMIWALRKT
jgi:hypothetical protein